MTWLMAVVLMITGAQTAAANAAAYTWPVSPVRVTRRFDAPPQPWLPGHRGVDLAGHPGQEITAAGAGTVSFAGTVAGTGAVSIVHQDGIKTTYEPVTPGVAKGETVSPGTRIGTLNAGHDGCPAEACLHWGAKRGDAYIDPLLLVGLGKIRLKPLSGAPAARPPAAAYPRRRRTPDRRRAAARPSR